MSGWVQRQPIASIQLHLALCHVAGVILESEQLHRNGYNDSFEHFNIRHEGKEELVNWDVKYYDMLQNLVGGGKAKMRWYFGEF